MTAWTLEQILAEPSSVEDFWFYGIVRDPGYGLRLCEVFPGIGYAILGWSDLRYLLRDWRWVIGDIRRRRPVEISA